MSPIRVRLTETAYEDIDGVITWLAENAPRKVEEWLDSLYSAIAKLEVFPERYPLAPESGKWSTGEIRQLSFLRYPSKYRILFRIDEDGVAVLQVRHSSRRYMHEPED